MRKWRINDFGYGLLTRDDPSSVQGDGNTLPPGAARG